MIACEVFLGAGAVLRNVYTVSSEEWAAFSRKFLSIAWKTSQFGIVRRDAMASIDHLRMAEMKHIIASLAFITGLILFGNNLASAQAQSESPNAATGFCMADADEDQGRDVFAWAPRPCNPTSLSPYLDRIRHDDPFIDLHDTLWRDPNDPVSLIRGEFLSLRELARYSVDPPIEVGGVVVRGAPRPIEIARAQNPEYQAITQAIEGWALAWSKKDAQAYLHFYGSDFLPADPRLSIDQWRQQRRARLGKPGNIDVRVRDLKIDLLGPDRAEAHFVQEYRYQRAMENTPKLLQLKRQDNQWRITSELAHK